MNKAQLAAVFLAGAAAGVGGSKLGKADAAAPAPQVRVHALDLRAGAPLPDGGIGEVSRTAYGTRVWPDGGTQDINAAKRCATSPARQAALRDELKAAATECDWP